MPLPATDTSSGPNLFGKGCIQLVQQLKYFVVLQKVVAHWWRPFLGRKVTFPQQARLFKFLEGVYPLPITLRDHQGIQNHQYD